MNESKPECEAALDVLQCRLDGDFVSDMPSVKQHLAECTSCRGRFAAAEKLLRAYPPMPRPGLADRVTLAVRTDNRQRYAMRWIGAAASLAACVAIALGVLHFTSPQPQPVIVKAPKSDGPIALARSTVSAWRDAAAQTLPTSAGRWSPTITAPDDVATALEPTALSLSMASKGLVDGFEPISESAKRAISMFRRELPTAE